MECVGHTMSMIHAFSIIDGVGPAESNRKHANQRPASTENENRIPPVVDSAGFPCEGEQDRHLWWKRRRRGHDHRGTDSQLHVGQWSSVTVYSRGPIGRPHPDWRGRGKCRLKSPFCTKHVAGGLSSWHHGRDDTGGSRLTPLVHRCMWPRRGCGWPAKAT